jgi:rod shape-determining protein MreC
LLLTDPESRIPVMLPESGMRAIVTGDGSAVLQPRFLPVDAVLISGARFVTSGQGGVLPPFLPVAVVQHDAAGQAQLYPAADPSRLTYVQLVDYSLAGGTANSFAHTIEPPP